MPRDPELKAKHLQAIAELGIKKQSPLKIIRQTCFDCAGESWKNVKACDDTKCPNWAYRHGFNPFSAHKNSDLSVKSNPMTKGTEKYGTFLTNDSQSSDRAGLGGRASERIPARRLPVVKIAILEHLLYFCNGSAGRYFGNNQFHGSDIEQIPCPKFCTSETRRRRFRELNADYNIARCINPNKSLYEITATKERLLEIIQILRRHEYGKSHAINAAR